MKDSVAEELEDKPGEDAGPFNPGLILALVTGIFFLFIGYRSVGEDIREVQKLMRLEEYTATRGVLLQVGVREDSTDRGDWYPDVLYDYHVDGKSIWGWRYSYEENARSRDYWERRLRGLEKGDSVTVYYNPDDPKDAVLERKHEGLWRPAAKMTLGLAFFLAGALLVGMGLWYLIRNLARSARRRGMTDSSGGPES